jgi:hypothetical protein
LKLDIFEVLDEQSIVCFTGKVNLLNSDDNKSLGSIIFIEGAIVNAQFNSFKPYKALMNLFIEARLNPKTKIIVEPELIQVAHKKLDYPISVIKRKAIEYIAMYEESIDLRPSDNIQLMVKPEFIVEGAEVSSQEYSLLCTMSDYNLVKDIYSSNDMLDYEITNALITLRKKDAIKVVETK